ncbi:hypothetical protein ACFE04_027620 [Oxalis oulophora]
METTSTTTTTTTTSVRMVVEERELDVEETIFVAVGNNVDDNRNTLLWTAKNFTANKICVLHVHQPSHLLSFAHKNLGLSKFKQRAVNSIQTIERQNIHILLNDCLSLLAQQGVEALDKVWLEMDTVEKGIVEIIVRNNIRWLVMGAAQDKYYSEEGGKDIPETAILCPIFHLDSDISSPKSEMARSDSLQLLNSSDAEEDNDETERKVDSQSPGHSTCSNNNIVGALESTLMLTYQEEKSEELITGETYSRLEQAIINSKDSKRRTFEAVVKRWKEEDDAMEANCKAISCFAKAMENLCVKEMSRRREMQDLLARQQSETKTIKSQSDEYMKELIVVNKQKNALQNQLVESNNMAKELEEKIISAVELLISFKDKRDKLRTECEKARKEAGGLKNAVKVDGSSLSRPQILTFSFMEINEATHEFDPSWKIGEGIHGSVYRGLIRHVQVAIKMLPSYGLQSPLEFQNKVEVLSRVRHPHLVTLIGICPESQSIIYEYLGNGSLEDRLACKDNSSPLSWQTRVRIATEICSVLIFLHSNKPSIVHGSLKPSNILLDDNFVTKLGDLGIFQVISPPKDKAISSTNMPNPNTTAYTDPEFLQSGMLFTESDVYSFGIVLLQMLTGRPASGIVKDVKCALERDIFNSLLDSSAGDWPLEQTKLLARVALRCCENRLNRPDLVSELWYALEPLKDECLAPTRSGPKVVHRRVPSHFVCPVFQEIMKDPQIAADGFTYEADAIRGWLKSGHNTSPMTNLKLEHCDLLPNYALHQAILEWQQRY